MHPEPSSRAFLFENLLLLVVPTATICSPKGMIPLETIKRDITTLGIVAKSLVISMGTNQTGKRFYQVKVKSPDTTSIKELGRLMEPLQMQAFRKNYGKILELTIAEVSIEAIASLTQYYDQPLRCFTFGDFQLVPTIEEFEEILGCPLGGRKPYLSSGCLPSLSRIATVVKDSARGLDRIKQTRNGIAGLPQKYLEDKARGMANQGDWVPFMDVLALLIFGAVLFPNVDGLIDLAAIDAFLAYYHSKESPVVAVLADLFDTFDRRCEKSSARIICCLPALCVWLVSHLFQQDTRHPCPLLSHRLCTEKRRMDWDQLLAGIGGRTISWFPRWKEGKEGVLFSCGRYPNIPLVGTRGCINYNPTLAIRQLGYPMRGAPTEESMSPFLVRDLGAQNSKTIQRIHKAWETPLRKDQELRGIRNGIIGGYHEWLKVRIRGLDWLAKLKVVSKESFEAPEEDEEVQALKSELGKAKLAKEKFKLAATHVRKECAGLREENAITARALEQETKRARKEEYGRNKFRGALWGSNSELKLRKEERDQSRAHSMVLKEELIACSRSKRSLSQRLCETETNMLAIIANYQEELGLATAHEHRIADEYAQVYAEKEARGRVIDSLHQEATMWIDRFALTLNGSQELPRLLAKAKAMADTYSAPEEIHGLLGYCQHMIDLMAHIIRNQETQEQMKADMSALKEQMASMMEAMLGMKQLMEKNAATAAAVSSAAEADPTLLATTHHPPSNIVGRGRDTLGHDGSPHLGYNRAAYPYGLPPNYSPPILQEDAGHIASPVHEKEPPQQPDEVHKDPQDYARRDVEFYPPIPEGPAPGTLPQPNIAASPIRWRDLAAQVAPPMVEREMITMMVDTLPVFYYEKLVDYMPSSFADLVFAGERIEVGLKRGKFDYVSSTNVNAKRIGATGAKRKEGDAHAVSSTPAWVKPQQTPHGTHQYAQHHPSFSAHAGNASSSTPLDEDRDKWTVWFDGASNILGHGVGAVLISPDNQCVPFTARLGFDCTNNMAEYEACALAVQAAIDSDVKLLKVYGDSALVIHQLRGEWETRDPKLIPYKAYIKELAKTFDEISFHHVPREENQMADALATLASMFQLTPHGDLPYIEFQCRGKPAHCCQVEEERDGKPWYYDIKRYCPTGN
ncbi:Ribonuclease HI [Glycine soja]